MILLRVCWKHVRHNHRILRTISTSQCHGNRCDDTKKVGNRVDKEHIDRFLQDRQSEWSIRIGLEIHAQVLSKTKLFSAAAADSDLAAAPNTHVSLFDASVPGTLPRLNRECVAQAIRTGLAMGATIPSTCRFERKHYFYYDSPLGYQITQLDHPIAINGHVAVEIENASGRNREKKNQGRCEKSLMPSRNVRIRRIQLEQDTGRSSHTLSRNTLVNLNRAGAALMEIVTEPDLHSAEEVGLFLRQLQTLLRHIRTCDANMESGSVRCDVNVSVHYHDTSSTYAKNDRVEIKNMNSLRSIERAINYEAYRQISLIEEAETQNLQCPIERETRSFNAVSGMTARLRSKEDAVDYRFMVEPDLPTISITPSFVASLESSLPELPDALKKRFCEDYGLSAYDAGVLVNEPFAAHFFETVLELVRPNTLQNDTQRNADANASDNGSNHAKQVANWVCNEFLGHIRERHKTIGDSDLPSAQDVADVIILQNKGTISGKIGKELLNATFEDRLLGQNTTPLDIVEKNEWKQFDDRNLIRALSEAVILAEIRGSGVDEFLSWSTLNELAKRTGETPENIIHSIQKMEQKGKKKTKRESNIIQKWKEGRGRVLDALVGRVMVLTKGKANPVVLSEELQSALSEHAS